MLFLSAMIAIIATAGAVLSFYLGFVFSGVSLALVGLVALIVYFREDT